MPEIVSPEYAIERIKILASDMRDVAGWLRENHPQEYERLEKLGMLEHIVGVFLDEEK